MVRQLAVLALFVCACRSNKAAENQPLAIKQPEAQAAPALPADASAAEQADEPDEPDELELDWQTANFSADLDGDGKADAIRWSCAAKLKVQVGSVKGEERLGLAELIGCSAAVLAPTSWAKPLLLVTADEHEEVGPDRHFLFAYDGIRLAQVWTDDADVVFRTDGTWVSSSSECNESERRLYTTTRIATWDGDKVSIDQRVETEPVDPAHCSDP